MDSLTLISGTKEDDVLSGTSGTDILLGGNGEDVLNGGGGNDLLSGGNGEDALYGGDGNDLLLAGNGNDLLDGGDGNDLLDGGNGNDSLDGGSGSDIILAGNGNDDANYTWSENTDSTNYYDGGKGFDTLQLTLTSAEFALAQEDIAAFNAFLHSGGYVFQFQSFDLTVRNFEALAFNIVGGNVAPEAQDDSYSLNEDSMLLVAAVEGVLAGDTDADGDALSAILVAGPAHGTLKLDPNGSFTYTPGLDCNGPDSFTYVASDGVNQSAAATVNLTIAAANDAPVAQGDQFATDEDVLVRGNVLANDCDVDSADLTATLVAGPENGVLEFNGDGTFTYTPVANAFGVESFTYQLSDGVLASEVTTVKLEIASVNDAPEAADDEIVGTAGGAGPIRVAVVGGSASSYEGVATQLDGSSTDFEFAADSILVTTLATKAAWLTMLANYDVVVVGESGLSVSDYDGSQLFAALRDFVDAGGGVVSTGWFAGEIAAYSNAAIRADADYISPAAGSQDSLYTGASSSISVLDASHPIAGGIAGYSVQGYAHELAGAVDASATVLASGGASALAAMAYDEVGPNGGLTVFLGSLHMANGAFASDATRGGAVDQILEQAVAWAAGEQDKGTAATDEDTVLSIDSAFLLANDTDVDAGDVFNILSVAAKSELGAKVSLDAVSGDVVYDPTKGLNYLSSGQIVTDSFTYTIADGHGGFGTAKVSLTVAGLNDALLPGGDEAQSIDQFYFEDLPVTESQSSDADNIELEFAIAQVGNDPVEYQDDVSDGTTAAVSWDYVDNDAFTGTAVTADVDLF